MLPSVLYCLDGVFMKLSILICHIPERAEKLELLMSVLRPQLQDGVEVLIETDDKEMTIGAKRNLLLSKAKGGYVCFVDDDDLVPDYYVAKILEAIELHGHSPMPSAECKPGEENFETVGFMSKHPDCIGIRGHYIWGERVPALFVHSLEYDDWQTVNGVHQRCPNHLNPIKRRIALEVKYPNKSQGEDIAYSRMLRGLLKTQVMIEDIMYYYYEGKF